MTETPNKIASHCTRCNAPVVLTVGDDCPHLRIEQWIKIITCNRCGQYLSLRRGLLEAIQWQCNKLATCEGDETRISNIRCKLEALTRRFVDMLCKRWTTTNDWHPEILDMLMSNPSKATIALTVHENAHRRAREQADAEAKQRTNNTP